MDLHLKGKTVVISGGSAGIGQETAYEFAREGCVVYITGRRDEKLRQAREEGERQGLAIRTGQVDATDEDAVRGFAQRVQDETGRIDIWVNNPGLALYKPFEEFTVNEVNAMLEVNFTTVWANGRIAAEYMKKQGGGVIVNASSYAKVLPHASGAIYSAVKSAVSSLTRTMAGELAPYNIRVVGYAPGVIKTEFNDEILAARQDELVAAVALRRLGAPIDVAKPIVFLASDAASFITGTDLEISGGKYTVQNIGYAWERKAAEA